MSKDDDALLIPRTLRTMGAMLGACVLFLGALSAIAAMALSKPSGSSIEPATVQPIGEGTTKQPVKATKPGGHDQPQRGTSI